MKNFSVTVNPESEKFFSKARKRTFGEKPQPRCDLRPAAPQIENKIISCIYVFKRSLYGRTLSEIKSDSDCVSQIASTMAAAVSRTIGENLSPDEWAVVTPPARRHKDWNFAKAVADEIATSLGIPHCNNVCSCKSRQRIGVDFTLENEPSQNNLIVFDDILTTGSTLQAMTRLLRGLGKNTVCFVAINNKL